MLFLAYGNSPCSSSRIRDGCSHSSHTGKKGKLLVRNKRGEGKNSLGKKAGAKMAPWMIVYTRFGKEKVFKAWAWGMILWRKWKLTNGKNGGIGLQRDGSRCKTWQAWTLIKGNDRVHFWVLLYFRNCIRLGLCCCTEYKYKSPAILIGMQDQIHNLFSASCHCIRSRSKIEFDEFFEVNKTASFSISGLLVSIAIVNYHWNI